MSLALLCREQALALLNRRDGKHARAGAQGVPGEPEVQKPKFENSRVNFRCFILMYKRNKKAKATQNNTN